MFNKINEKNFHLAGWVLFTLCSFFYLSSSVITGDIIGIIGGVLFFLGCLAFMIPMFKKAD